MYYWTKDIIIDPADNTQSTWYVGVFSGWGGAPNGKGGLYKTTNRGMNWTKLTDTQFDRVTSLTFNPLNNNQAFLTTETQGLWMSENMDATLPTWALVESYPFRQPERVYFNPYKPSEIWVTSFGNGMKVGDMNAPSSTSNLFKNNGLTTYPNPAADHIYFEFKDKSIHLNEVCVYTLTGQHVLTRQGDITSLDIQALNSGMYLLQCTFEGGYMEWVKVVME
jgi:hypothetical protein